MKTLRIASAVHPYTARIEAGCVTRPCAGLLSELDPAKTVLLADRNVLRLHPRLPVVRLLRGRTIPLTATEDLKTLEGAGALFKKFLELGVTRRHRIVALGGGIIQDIAAFACQSYMRGLEWWLLPSTLLSQADSCVGSKSSINFSDTKNLLGSFYPPQRIFVDPELLRTLPRFHVDSGLGEVFKVHCMAGSGPLTRFIRELPGLRRLDRSVLEAAIHRSLAIKLRWVRVDEFDRGPRQVLNFGHCYGHALEAASAFRVPHGIGVAVGIVFSFALSRQRGLVSQKETERAAAVASRLTAGHRLPDIPPAKILPFLRKDKKREGADLAVILTRGPGQVLKAVDVRAEEFFQAHAETRALLGGAGACA